MSIASWQTAINTLLAGVANGQTYLQMAPTDVDPPFVVIRLLSAEPITTLNGAVVAERVLAVFECYDRVYDDALSLRDEVAALIDASSLTKNREPSPGEELIVPVGMTMEPLYYGFWV